MGLEARSYKTNVEIFDFRAGLETHLTDSSYGLFPYPTETLYNLAPPKAT